MRAHLRRPTAPLSRLTTVVVTAVAAALLLTGCRVGDLQGTNGKQYIDGKGVITQIKPSDRGAPVDASGPDLDGKTLDLADYRGKVVVLNTWAAWCAPCVAEMPSVVALSQELDTGRDAGQVVTLGVNVREIGGTSAAKAFVAQNKMSFPSFYDPSSSLLLSLTDKVGPYSLPSTIVLDKQGRLAALVLGRIPGLVSMREIVEQVAAGD